MADARASGPNPTGDSAKSLKEVGGFQLLQKIGQGGMGSVFKARQKSLDRIVALKILPPSVAKDTKFIDRFQREARACAKLNHPNIVQGIDVGKDEATGLWYFAMELVEGPSLLKVLKEQRVLPEERAIEIGLDVAKALDCAATQGIVHRDIKPDNILLTLSGEAKLADLGLAKQLTDDSSVTQSGQAIGTPYYMSPEQVRGQSDQIDQRTDIYALGGTLFHLVTGQPPFQGETSPVIMTKHLTEPPPKANKINPEVSESFTRLITRMMQKKKEQRVQSAKELIAALEKIRDGEDTATPARNLRDTTGPRTAVSTRTTPPPRKSNNGVVMALGGAAVVAVLVAVMMSGKRPEPEPTPRVASNDPPRAERRNDPPPQAAQPTPAPGPGKKPKKERPAPPTEKTPGPVNPAASLIEFAKPETPETAPPDAAVADPDAVIAKSAKGDGEKPVVPAPKQTDTAKPVAEAPVVPGPQKTPALVAPKTPEPANLATALKRDWKGFKVEYYEGQNFERLKNEDFEPAIDVRWPKGAPAGMSADLGVSARWSGFIEPPESGEYTFEVSAQAGGRVYLDDACIFDNWAGRQALGKTLPITLDKTKKYELQFELRQKGSDSAAVATLKWSLGSAPATLVNADPPETEAQGLPVGHLASGWKAEYGKWESETPLVTRSEPAINWDWHYASPAALIPVDKFWARWTGLVVPPETDEYVFSLNADDGARLQINDMSLIDFMNTGGKGESPPLKLEKGKRYLVKVDYLERADYANISLKWSSKTIKDSLVRAMPPGDPDGVLPLDGFLAEYGALGSPKVLLTRRELVIASNWKYGSPSADVPVEKFWARYTGWIVPPADGEYTLGVDYDEGVYVYLDDVMFYDSGNRGGDAKADLPAVALKTGKKYFLRVEFRDWGDYARIFMTWHSAAMPKRLLTGLIPDAVKADSKEVGHIDAGLLAEYGSTGKTPLVKRLEGRLFHDFHSGSPAPEIPANAYWGKWTGGLRITTPGSYAFKVDAEATADVKLNGVSVVKVPVPPTPGVKPPPRDPNATKATAAESQPLNLNKGTTYFLEVSFTNKRGDYSFIKLSWKPPGKAEFEEIPADVFLLPPQARQETRRK